MTEDLPVILDECEKEWARYFQRWLIELNEIDNLTEMKEKQEGMIRSISVAVGQFENTPVEQTEKKPVLNLWETWFGPPLGNHHRSDCYVWCVEAIEGSKTKVVYDKDNSIQIYHLDRDGRVKAISHVFENTKYDIDHIEYKVWDDRVAYLIPKKQ